MHLDVKREDPKKKRNYSIKPSNAMQSNAALIASVLAQKQAPKPVSIRASMAAVIRASIHAPGKPVIANDMQAVLNMPTMADKSRKQATK